MDSEREKLTLNELELLLKQSAIHHRSYKYYGDANRINQILKDGVLYLSDGSGWNDLVDGKNFSRDKNKFAKSFTFVTNENVSMWMLYGNQGHGAMINFSRSNIEKIMQVNEKTQLMAGHFVKGRFVDDLLLTIEDIFLIDIAYCDTELSNDVIMSYSDEKVILDTMPEIPYFIKDQAWKNESECRLIVKVKEKLKQEGLFLKLVIPDEVLAKLRGKAYDGPSVTHGINNPSILRGKINWT